MQAPAPTTRSKTATHTPRMRRLGPGLWCVESKTTPGLGHKCTVDACSCPAGKHGRLCWHRKLVRRAEAWLAGYAVTTGASAPLPPVPAPVPATLQATADAGMRRLQEAFE